VVVAGVTTTIVGYVITMRVCPARHVHLRTTTIMLAHHQAISVRDLSRLIRHQDLMNKAGYL
jgi:hypothetical protein